MSSLRTKIVASIIAVFALVLGISYLFFEWVERDTMEGLGAMFTRRQVLYNNARIRQPLLRELALAQKLAQSSAIKAWARDEDAPSARAAGLTELDEYRQFFADKSYFFVVDASHHYYFNDATGTYTGSELRYTLSPDDPEHRWYFKTIESREPYQLNVDYDEQLKVTKVWLNVVVRDGDRALGVIGTGIDLSTFVKQVVSSGQDGVTNIFIETGGAIQAHAQRELIDFRSISKAPSERKAVFQLLDDEDSRQALQEAMDRARTGNGAEVTFAQIDGRQYLIGLGYLSEIGWFTVSLVDIQTVIGSSRFVPFALLLLAALLLLLGLSALTLHRVVLQRVSRLDTWVRDFAEGTMKVSKVPLRADEIGRLEQGFQRMATAVRRHTEELEEAVVERTQELADKNAELVQALADVRTLRGLLPICSYCKNIRDEDGEWMRLEAYIGQRSSAEFTHGVCPACFELKFGDSEPPPQD